MSARAGLLLELVPDRHRATPAARAIAAHSPRAERITNEDFRLHTFTLDDGSVDESVAPGASVTVNVDVSETTGFVCRVHPEMTGTIEVA